MELSHLILSKGTETWEAEGATLSPSDRELDSDEGPSTPDAFEWAFHHCLLHRDRRPQLESEKDKKGEEITATYTRG